jgi:phytoene/squalene synthetase
VQALLLHGQAAQNQPLFVAASRHMQGVPTLCRYCHYVAGLVGIGLSELFASSGLEDESFGGAEELSNHMGLLLQVQKEESIHLLCYLC